MRSAKAERIFIFLDNRAKCQQETSKKFAAEKEKISKNFQEEVIF